MDDKIEYCINNLNREKIFKEVLKVSNVYDVCICENYIKFCVDKKAQKNVDLILEKKNAKVLNKKNFGGFNFFKNIFKKWEFVVPIIIFIALLIYFNNFVFCVEIKGLEQIEEIEVVEVLNDCNISNFTLKRSINLKELENNILKINKVSMVSVAIKGNTLIVNIKEKVYNAEFEERDNFLPIVSRYCGIVTNINVVSGTPLVKVGQTVKIGQELIAPYVIDTSGQKKEVFAKGEIFADVFFFSINEFCDLFYQYLPTGNVICNKQIFIGNIKIFDQENKCDFLEFKIEQNQEIFKDAVLPIKIVETKYYEQKVEVIENYFEKNKAQILEDCKQKTRQLIPNYDIIKDEYYDITSLAGINRVTYTYLVEMQIT